MQIGDIACVISFKEDELASKIESAVKRMQDSGLTAEIQYSTAGVGSTNSLKLSALIIGRSKE